MWEFYRVDKVKITEKAHRIQVRDDVVFDFDVHEDWAISEVQFNHDGKGTYKRMIIILDYVGEREEEE